jgi:sigma-E factor negative regulatory protein RseB
MEIVHQADADGEHERLISLDGSHRELVRDRESAICIIGNSKPIFLDHAGTRTAFPASPVGNLAALRDYYSLHLGAAVRAAGRPARLLEIQPRDALRYGYRIWVDDATALPLKSELVGADGGTLEQILFTELAVFDAPDAPDATLRERISARKAWARAMRENRGEESAEPARQWSLETLPAGFMLVGLRRYRAPESANLVEHLVFSDGLATVSAYVEQAGARGALNGATRRGAVSSYATLFDTHQVVVIGDVPMPTARAIGAALRPTLEQAP